MMILRLELQNGETWEVSADSGVLLEEEHGVRHVYKDSLGRNVGEWEFIPWGAIKSFKRVKRLNIGRKGGRRG
jgi:hypothetical protein